MSTKASIIGMVTLIGTPLAAFATPSFTCATLEKSDAANAQTCTVQTEAPFTNKTVSTPIHLLALRGTVDETAYSHGRLLAKHFDKGAVPAVLGEIDRSMESLPAIEKFLFTEIQKCVLKGYRSSLTPDFIRLHKRLADGLKAGGVSSFSEEQLLKASLGVELSIFADGFKKKMGKNPLQALTDLAVQCDTIPNFDPAVVSNALQNSRSGTKFGCTGIAAPQSYTSDHSLVFGRNFDSSLVGQFEKQPVVIMQIPPRGHRYVGVASVGLHYAGGISGFNDAGIVVSSHELQTEEYMITHKDRSGAIGPFVQNMVLERAGSIDEAIAVVKSYKHYGAWTIFIADTKTNEIASLEFTGKSFAVARRVQNAPRVQTNHFLSPQMTKANFEYSYNKTLESRSRLSYLEKQAAESVGQIDTQWIMNKLASHTDDYVGRRSFGRTATKAYGTMTHVMVPEKRIFWTTLGDSFPVPSSTFVGFEVNFDFDRTGGEPFRFIGFQKAQSDDSVTLPNWTRALGVYVNSYIAFRDRTATNAGLAKSYSLLSEAIALAEIDGVFELPYHFIRGRVGIIDAAEKILQKQIGAASATLDIAITDLDAILSQNTAAQIETVPYEVALAHLWKARAIDLKLSTLPSRSPDFASLDLQRKEHYSQAKTIFEQIISSDNRSFYVKKLVASFSGAPLSRFKTYKPNEAVKEDIDFITME